MIYNLLSEPYPYQHEGIGFLLKNKKVILGDKVGAGKTLQALAVITSTGHKAFVICPGYLRQNWVKEIRKHTYLSCRVLDGTYNYPFEEDVLIISYSSLHKIKKIQKERKICIMDEAHYIKNIDTQRTEAAHNLLDKSVNLFKYIILLTGTAIKNKVPEFYSLLCAISYSETPWFGELYSYDQFCREFCYASERRLKVKGKNGRTFTIRKVDYSGLKNKEKLRSFLKGKYICRKLDSVLGLPKIVNQFVPVDYREEDAELLEEWEKFNDNQKYSATVKKRSALKKAPFTARYVNNLLEQHDTPIVVFTCHPKVCSILEKELKKTYRLRVITGDTSPDTRFEYSCELQEGKLDLLLATVGSAQAGLDLFASNLIVFNDISFVPSDNEQCKGRIRRKGQAKNHVQFHFITGSFVDEMIVNKVIGKEKDIEELDKLSSSPSE